jgi:disintegrin and metalloproteinase domain-containing protein 10
LLFQLKINCWENSIVSQVLKLKKIRNEYKNLYGIECSQIGYCGNRNVEDDEECDCGFSSECTDQCCYPAEGSDPKLACKLKPGARCRYSTKL